MNAKETMQKYHDSSKIENTFKIMKDSSKPCRVAVVQVEHTSLKSIHFQPELSKSFPRSHFFKNVILEESFLLQHSNSFSRGEVHRSRKWTTGNNH